MRGSGPCIVRDLSYLCVSKTGSQPSGSPDASRDSHPLRIAPAGTVAPGALGVGPPEVLRGPVEVPAFEGLQGAVKRRQERRVAQRGGVEGLEDLDRLGLAQDADPSPAPPDEVGPIGAEADGSPRRRGSGCRTGRWRAPGGRPGSPRRPGSCRTAAAGAERADQAVGRRGAADLHAARSRGRSSAVSALMLSSDALDGAIRMLGRCRPRRAGRPGSS